MDNQPIVTRTYRARTLGEATVLFQADAAQLATTGYTLAGQVWADGGRTSAASLCLALGLLLAFVGVLIWMPLAVLGLIFVAAGALSGKGPGTLSATFRQG